MCTFHTYVDDVIMMCEKYLVNPKPQDIYIEMFLTRYLLIHMCGKYQNDMNTLARKKARQGNSALLVNKKIDLDSASLDTFEQHILIPHGYSKNDVKKIVGSSTISMYDSMIINRNMAAHGDSVSIPITKLHEHHACAVEVINALSNILGVSLAPSKNLLTFS